MRKTLIAVIVLLLALSAFAQEGGTEKKVPVFPVGIVNSSNGMVYPKGQKGIVLKHFSITKDQLYSSTDEADFNPSPRQVKEVKVKQTQAVLRYGLGGGFDVRMLVPHMSKEMKLGINQGGNTMIRDFDDSGLGDVIVFGRYQILNQKKGDPFFLTAGIGIKFPTGESKEKKDGSLLPMAVQNGSGSTDYIAEIGFTKLAGKHRIDAHTMYFYRTEGSQDFKFGNLFKFDTGYSYAFNRYFDAEIELNGSAMAKNEQDGSKVDSSGGTEFFLTPGFHIKFRPNLHLSMGVPVNIYRDINGTQPTADYTFVARLGFIFR